MTAPTAARADRFGERFYPVPDPATGEVVDLPSITRIMKVLDAPGLTVWQQKVVAWQVAINPDLAALASTAKDEKDKVLWQVVKAAKDRHYSAALVGTAAHTLSEQSDAGTLDVTRLPAAVKPIMERYEELRARYGWQVVASEETVYNHEVGYAGTFDRILDLPGYGLVVADLKTGAGVYGDVAMQLAAAANAEGTWDGERHGELPDGISLDLGVVIHIPAQPTEGAPTHRLVLVDISNAARAFQACREAYEWVNGPAKEAVLGEVEAHLSESYPQALTSTFTSGQSQISPVSDSEATSGVGVRGAAHPPVVTLVERVERLKNFYPQALDALSRAWPAGVPTFKQSDAHTADQLALIDKALWKVERDHVVPFPDEEPPRTDLRSVRFGDAEVVLGDPTTNTQEITNS